MYWRYWKRGWWSWLMQLCANLLGLLLFLPIAHFYAEVSPAIYIAVAAVMTIVVILPIFGWLFELFARNSERIGAERVAKSD